MILANRFSYADGFEDKCGALLDRALAQVPVYRQWQRFDPGSEAGVEARFDALPVLTKADMRDNFPHGLMPDDQDLAAGLASEAIEYTFTSGTTADKVVNIWDQSWWDRSEAASWQLNRHLAGLAHPQKQAKLASALNVGISCEEDLPMSHRILGNTLYLNEKTSVLQWQPRHLARMAAELNAYRPVILEANPSLLARLAYWAIDNATPVFSPAVIVFTFEFPSAIHLAAIGQVFRSALVSSYGTTETGFVLEQCADGLMHQNADFCRIDFQPLKDEFGGPDLGRIFVTTFDNPFNYIIRFDVGDLIRLHAGDACTCGRTEGMIADAVEGRVGNVTFTTAGGLVTTKALDDRIASVAAVRDYHLEQSGPVAYRLEAKLAPPADPTAAGAAEAAAAAAAALRAVLADVYGADGSFDVQIVADILPGPAGKYRRTRTDFEFSESELFV